MNRASPLSFAGPSHLTEARQKQHLYWSWTPTYVMAFLCHRHSPFASLSLKCPLQDQYLLTPHSHHFFYHHSLQNCTYTFSHFFSILISVQSVLSWKFLSLKIASALEMVKQARYRFISLLKEIDITDTDKLYRCSPIFRTIVVCNLCNAFEIGLTIQPNQDIN